MPRKTYTSKKLSAELHVTDCMDMLTYHASCTDADLIFADPPFNYGVQYDSYDDSMSWDEYFDWTSDWLEDAASVMKPGASLFVHCPDEIAGHVRVTLEKILQPVNWIILHQEFGQYNDSRLIRSHQHLLWFCNGEYVFNKDEVLAPSRRLQNGDARTTASRDGGYRPLLDVWYGPNLGRIQGNNKERVKECPNQLPEMYLARIIRMASHEGDVVVDPFTGSGTTGAVAVALNRTFVGSEIGAETAKRAWNRITRRGVVRDVAGPLVRTDSRIEA